MTDEAIPEIAIINGRYRNLRVLGQGSQGKVVSAIDTLEGNRAVAIKILTSADGGSRFRFEFQQAKRLDHPHLARVYDMGVITEATGVEGIERGSAFYTQELVDGVPAHVYARSVPANELSIRVVKVGVAVARALELLHRRGLLHRDVKPSNILVGSSGDTIKLIDLGLAAMKTSSDGLRAGTLSYMAPEAIRSSEERRVG